MKKIFKWSIIIFVLILVFFYLPYRNRQSWIHDVNEFNEAKGFVRVFHFNEFQFNPFDYIIEDAQNVHIVSIDPTSYKIDPLGNIYLTSYGFPNLDEEPYYVSMRFFDGKVEFQLFDLNEEVAFDTEEAVLNELLEDKTFKGAVWRETVDWMKKNHPNSMTVGEYMNSN